MNIIGGKFEDMQKIARVPQKKITSFIFITLILCLSFSIRTASTEELQNNKAFDEIDEGRHKKALANFKEAGLSEYIEARLADAHDLVEKLKGPFDFVFSGADKDWYKNYSRALAPKLEVGGCFTAHNARSTGAAGIREFIDYVTDLPNFNTTIDTTSRAGISISYKIADK